MTAPRARSVLVWVLIGAILASAFPVLLTIGELARLRSSLQQIDRSTSLSRQVQAFLEQQLGRTLTQLTAVAVKLDDEERDRILSEADRSIAEFSSSAVFLREWLDDQQLTDLWAAIEAIQHSWEELKQLRTSEISEAELAFHFLQITDSANKARTLTSELERRAADLARAQTDLAFAQLERAGTLLMALIVIGILINAAGSLTILQSFRAARRSAAEASVQNERFEAALNNMVQGLSMFDSEQRLVVCNSKYASIFGIPGHLTRPGTAYSEILAHRIASGAYAGPDPAGYLKGRLDNARTSRASELMEARDDRRILITRTPMPSGGWLSMHEDVTERMRVEAQIARMVRYDTVTELPNRVLFREELVRALARGKRSDEAFAVFWLDLDGFKAVNDAYGHAMGDLLLKQVGERLLGCVRDADVVARLGGDEFAILQYGAKEETDASTLAARIVEAIAKPFTLEGVQAVIGVSVGIAIGPSGDDDPDQLLKNADLALYRAKAEGKGRYCFFEPTMDLAARARRTLELELRNAYRNTEFELFYQPLIRLATGEVRGFEALIRWHHPERGVIAPAEFIPVAEEIGLIGPIGEWVIREACTQAARWPHPMHVAVNLSPEQFNHHSDIVQIIMSALAAAGLAPERLELEITESVLLAARDDTLAKLHALRATGIRIALDDFGTGYSSLSYLRNYPFDKIKIDRTFVHDLGVREDSLAIVRTVVGLAKALGMTPVAEGVETQQQLEQLRALGCTEAQGYLFSPPRPYPEIARLHGGPGDLTAAAVADPAADPRLRAA